MKREKNSISKFGWQNTPLGSREEDEVSVLRIITPMNEGLF